MIITRKIGNTLQEMTWNEILVSLVESLREQLESEEKPSLVPDAVLELYQKIENNALSKALLADIGRRTGLDESRIVSHIKDLQDFLVEAQEGLEPLLLPIGELVDEAIKIDLNIVNATKEYPVGSMALMLSAESSAQIKIQNFVAPEPPLTWRGSGLKPGRALLQSRMHGGIAVRGCLTGAFGSLGIGFRGARVRSGTVKLFHEFAASRSRAEALIVAAKHHAPPWDLRGLQKALVKPNAQGAFDGFRGVQIQAQGEMSLELEASLGASYSYAGHIGELPGEDADIVEASIQAGANLKTRVSYDSSVVCWMEKQADDSLLVSFSAGTTGVRAHDFTLGLDVDVEGLDGIAREYTDRVFSRSDLLVERLRPWTRPGRALLDRMESTDWDSGPVKQLGSFLLGAEEKESSLQKAGRDYLKNKIAQLLDKTGMDWLQDPEIRVTSAVEQAVTQLAVSDELSTLLVEDVTSRVMSHWSSVEDTLESTLKDAFSGEDVSELLNGLSEAGIELDEHLKSAREFVKSDIKLFREFLNRYDEVRQQIESALQSSANKRLGLRFFANTAKQREEDVLLSFSLKKVNPETISIFRSMLLGRIDLWSDQFINARKNGWIDHVDGLFSSVLQIERSIGFKLNLGEVFSLERSRTRFEKIEIVADENGTLNVANASIRNVATSASRRIRRQTSLIGYHDFVSSAAGPNKSDGTLNLSVSYANEDASPARLQEFLESMENARTGMPLIPQGAAERAADDFEKRVSANGLDSVVASIRLHLPVTFEDLQELLQFSDAEIFRRAVDVQLDNILSEQEYDTLETLMSSRRRGPEDRYALARSMGHYQGVGSNSFNVGNLLRDLGFGRNSNLQARVRQRFLGKLHTTGTNAALLIKAVRSLRKLLEIHARIADSTLDREGGPVKDLEGEISRQLGRFNRVLSPWLQVTGTIRGLFSESAHPNTLALLLLLRDLVQPDSYVLPVLEIEDVDNGLIVVV